MSAPVLFLVALGHCFRTVATVLLDLFRSVRLAAYSRRALAAENARRGCNGKNATVVFAGLSPGFVGLYQVNVTVPADVKEGRVPLVVIQNGVPSNAAMLPVIK